MQPHELPAVQEAAEFKAFQDRQAERQGRAAAAGAGRKRSADGAPDKTGAKASKPAGPPRMSAPVWGLVEPEGSRPISKTGSGPHKPLQGSGPQRASGQGHTQQQGGCAPPPPARSQQHGAALVAGADKAPPRLVAPPPHFKGLVALAESGVDPSHPSAEDTQALSPTGQVAQSPYRHRPLQPGLSAAVAIKQEQQERGSPLPDAQQGVELGQQAAAAQAPAPDGGPTPPSGAAGDAAHSPARMSCADASQLLGGAGAAPAGGAHLAQQRLQQQQQQALSQPAASGAGAVGPQVQAGELPDPLVLAGDEAGVYVAMGRLLGLVASAGGLGPQPEPQAAWTRCQLPAACCPACMLWLLAAWTCVPSFLLLPPSLPPCVCAAAGHVPGEAVAAYRRSFMRLDPHGKRWFAYDSLKQLVDAGEWADVHEWLLCK